MIEPNVYSINAKLQALLIDLVTGVTLLLRQVNPSAAGAQLAEATVSAAFKETALQVYRAAERRFVALLPANFRPQEDESWEVAAWRMICTGQARPALPTDSLPTYQNTWWNMEYTAWTEALLNQSGFIRDRDGRWTFFLADGAEPDDEQAYLDSEILARLRREFDDWRRECVSETSG